MSYHTPLVPDSYLPVPVSCHTFDGGAIILAKLCSAYGAAIQADSLTGSRGTPLLETERLIGDAKELLQRHEPTTNREIVRQVLQ